MAKIKKIEGFNDYSITDTGKVLSERAGRFKWLKQAKSKKGYFRLILMKDGKAYPKTVHRIVAQAFIPNPENKPCVDHINGVRTDNRVCNLRWCTNKENCSFPLARKNMSEARKNTQINRSDMAKSIAQYTNEGVLVAIYPSLMEASRQTGIHHGHISSCCLKKKYRRSAGGYKWVYI